MEFRWSDAFDPTIAAKMTFNAIQPVRTKAPSAIKATSVVSQKSQVRPADCGRTTGSLAFLKSVIGDFCKQLFSDYESSLYPEYRGLLPIVNKEWRPRR